MIAIDHRAGRPEPARDRNVRGPSQSTSASDPATRDRSIQFGRVVRAYRLGAGLSQEQLAEKAGCDRQSINRVENAAYSPSLPRIFRLADALGVPVGDLFADTVPAIRPGRTDIR